MEHPEYCVCGGSTVIQLRNHFGPGGHDEINCDCTAEDPCSECLEHDLVGDDRG
jgi:hypothetical protein